MNDISNMIMGSVSDLAMAGPIRDAWRIFLVAVATVFGRRGTLKSRVLFGLIRIALITGLSSVLVRVIVNALPVDLYYLFTWWWARWLRVGMMRSLGLRNGWWSTVPRLCPFPGPPGLFVPPGAPPPAIVPPVPPAFAAAGPGVPLVAAAAAAPPPIDPMAVDPINAALVHVTESPVILPLNPATMRIMAGGGPEGALAAAMQAAGVAPRGVNVLESLHAVGLDAAQLRNVQVAHATLDARKGYRLVASADHTILPRFWAGIYLKFRATQFGDMFSSDRYKPGPMSESDLLAARRALLEMIVSYGVRSEHIAVYLPQIWLLITTDRFERFNWRAFLKQERSA